MKYMRNYIILMIMMAIPYFIVITDNVVFQNSVRKLSLTSISHGIFLIIDIILLLIIRKREPDLKSGLTLIIGLFVAMLIRENRALIRFSFNGQIEWSVIDIVVSLLFIYMAIKKGVRKAFRNLGDMHKFHGYNYVICGLILVLIWSRLIGNGFMWRLLAAEHYTEAIKNSVEEPTQSLGYLIIMFGLFIIMTAEKNLYQNMITPR